MTGKVDFINLLIVDDNPENLRLIAGFFDDSYYFVRTATTDSEALDLCLEIEFDLILLDIRMPVDGFTVFNQIRGTNRNHSTPVIFMAEKTDLENITRAFQSGCRDVITKPFQLDELLTKVSVHTALHIHSRQIRELLEAKEKIYAIIGHDLRSPFNALIGFSELLIENLQEAKDPESFKIAQIINRISVKNLELLDNLLVYARDLEKKAQNTFVRINVNKLISEILAVVQPAALLKHIQLVQVFGPPRETMGSKDLLATLIRNLLNNAMKYTPAHGIVTIRTQLVGFMIEIDITDTGIGMDDDTIRRFTTGESIASKPGTAGETGSGFGLLLAREIVTRHNGKMEIMSQLGEGTRVRVQLPQCR